jgi:type I restriction enzyme S subunit
LGEIAKWGSGGTPNRSIPEYYSGSIPWFKTGELNDDVVTEAEEFLTENGLRNSSAKLFPKGSIMIAMYGATIGKCAILGVDGSTNQACAVAQPNPGTEPRFLFYYLRSQKQNFIDKGKGGAQPNISQTIIQEHPFPLPPLSEQKLIVAKLDTLFARLDQLRSRLDKIPILLKRFRQAVLTQAVTGKLTEEWRTKRRLIDSGELLLKLQENHTNKGGHKKGNASAPTEGVHNLQQEDLPITWSIAELKDLCHPDSPITYGILMPGPDIKGGVPYIRVADFPNDNLNLSTIRKTSITIDSEFRRSKLASGDLLLSIRGTVGRVCLIPNELNGANITQDSARLRIQDCVMATYVLWYLRSPVAQERMGRATKGVAVKGINIGDVRAFQIALPSIEEQREIVQRVESLFSVAGRIEAEYKLLSERIGCLPSAILSKAFRGELVEDQVGKELKAYSQKAEDLLMAAEPQDGI